MHLIIATTLLLSVVWPFHSHKKPNPHPPVWTFTTIPMESVKDADDCLIDENKNFWYIPTPDKGIDDGLVGWSNSSCIDAHFSFEPIPKIERKSPI